MLAFQAAILIVTAAAGVHAAAVPDHGKPPAVQDASPPHSAVALSSCKPSTFACNQNYTNAYICNASGYFVLLAICNPGCCQQYDGYNGGCVC